MSKLHYGKEPADGFVEGRRGHRKCTLGVHLVKMHAAREAATAANLEAFLTHVFYPLKECYSKKGDCGPFFQECIDLVKVCQTGETLEGHLNCDHFLDTISGRQKDIYSQLSSQINDAVEKNRHILKSMVDVIVLRGQQNLALRGHTEKNSNFLALLEFRAKTDPVLATHLQSAEKRARHTSPTIQN